MTAPPLRVLALASYPIEAASTRYRIAQFIEPLRARGIEVRLAPFLDSSLYSSLYVPRRLVQNVPRITWRTLRRMADAIRAADVVFVQREAMLFGPPFVEWLATSLRRRPMVLDLDDATYVSYVSPVYGTMATALKWSSKADHLIERARIVTCGSPSIAEHVRGRGSRAVLIPTVVDLDVFRPALRRSEGPPVVGWIGSHGTSPYLRSLTNVLETLAAEEPFRLRIIGAGREPIVIRGADVEQRPWELESEVEDFRSLDIGLYPLCPDRWSEGKSGLKAVQYMACGIPFVMSPVGVCASMGVPDETHFSAATEEEWLSALRRLVRDATLRQTMGARGREFAEAHYQLADQAAVLADVLREAAS